MRGMKRLWCNGGWIDAERLPASPMDRGSLHGLGLFETMLALDGRPVFPELHLARLTAACSRLGWPDPCHDFPELPEAIREISAGIPRARVRLTVTAGSGPLADLGQGRDRLVWLTAAPSPEPPDSVTLAVAPWPRNERSPLAGLKCAAYAENLVVLDHARRSGCDDALVFNTRGEVCETATANVFFVRDGMLITPPLSSGCLPGVTRAVVLRLAAEHGIPCREEMVGEGDLPSFREMFLTSATRGPLPVKSLAGRALQSRTLGDEIRSHWTAAIRCKSVT